MNLWEALPLVEGNSHSPRDRAPVIDRDSLAGIEDGAPVRNSKQNYDEASAYNRILVTAHRTPLPALARSSRKDLTFVHLYEEPAKYRGELVHLRGQLRRLIRFDPPPLAVQEGVRDLYEGWLFPESSPTNPYCIVMSEVPKGIQLGEKVDYAITFDGYFFKRYRYKAGDGWRDAPLLIGHTLRLENTPAPPEDTDSWSSGMLLPAFLSLVVATFLLGISLSWWYRKGDRRVRDQLDQARDLGLLEPESDARSFGDFHAKGN